MPFDNSLYSQRQEISCIYILQSSVITVFFGRIDIGVLINIHLRIIHSQFYSFENVKYFQFQFRYSQIA